MKSAVKIVLFLFIVFLATPTVVSLIERNSDTSIFYSMAEEEQPHKDIKEVKAQLKFTDYGIVSIPRQTNSLIISGNRLKHDNVSASIFSPPPNA